MAANIIAEITLLENGNWGVSCSCGYTSVNFKTGVLAKIDWFDHALRSGHLKDVEFRVNTTRGVMVPLNTG